MTAVFSAHRKRTHISVAQRVYGLFLSGTFRQLRGVRLGHVSECFGQIGDRSSSRPPPCEERACSAEGDGRLGAGQELHRRQGRSAAAVRRLAARLPGVSAVQEAAEVRRTHGTHGTH